MPAAQRPKPLGVASQEAARRSRGFRNELLYTGRCRDPETGLQLNRHRFYHQQLGRWVSRDPILYVESVNLYQYVHASPVIASDPSGLMRYVGIGLVIVCQTDNPAPDWGTVGADGYITPNKGIGDEIERALKKCFQKHGPPGTHISPVVTFVPCRPGDDVLSEVRGVLGPKGRTYSYLVQEFNSNRSPLAYNVPFEHRCRFNTDKIHRACQDDGCTRDEGIGSVWAHEAIHHGLLGRHGKRSHTGIGTLDSLPAKLGGDWSDESCKMLIDWILKNQSPLPSD